MSKEYAKVLMGRCDLALAEIGELDLPITKQCIQECRALNDYFYQALEAKESGKPPPQVVSLAMINESKIGGLR